jgi:hypothetical protein
LDGIARNLNECKDTLAHVLQEYGIDPTEHDIWQQYDLAEGILGYDCGNLTLAQIVNRLRGKLAADRKVLASEASGDGTGGTTGCKCIPGELAALLDTTTATVNKYARLADVPTPGRGQRGPHYTRENGITICKSILEHSRDGKLRQRARELLTKPAQIQPKSHGNPKLAK